MTLTVTDHFCGAGGSTVGSLFSGYGGLDLGVTAAIGGTVAWHVEVDPAPSRILAHHWPDVPNLGDITAVNWNDVEPVDVITGGFPCQDVSLAGRRAGLIRDGEGRTRSGLWGQMLRAVDTIRPALVVAENVRGLLSAEADSDVEPCPWCMGDGDGEPAVRALGAVLADLAGLGYDAWWTGLRAADVGAPHGRFRVFIFAAAADAAHVRHERGWYTRKRWSGPADSSVTSSNTARDGRDKGRTEPAGVVRGSHVAKRRASSPADTDSGGLERVGWFEPTEPASWGPYADAVARWEYVLGRRAPNPTEPGRNGPRLSPAFTEWLMGLPAGHVTDPAIGLTRAEQLKALGNGVVPQQASAAVTWWLDESRSHLDHYKEETQ